MNITLAPPHAPPNARPATPLRGVAGLALLFVLLLPPLLWRAGGQASLGADELRSLMLTQQPPRRLVGSAPLADQYPPGYPLLLKAWNKAGHLIGIPVGVPWGRLPGVLAWCAMAGAAWVLGRRQLGAGGGALLAWTLALGSQGALAARLMSGEALAAPALAIALLALLEVGNPGRANASTRGSAALWALYAAAGVLAVLTNRLAAPFMAGCFALWLIMLASAFPIPGKPALRIPHSALFRGGLPAHLLILLAAAAPAALLPADERAMAGLRESWLGFEGAAGKAALFALGHAFGLVPHALLAPRGAGALTALAFAAFLLPAGLVAYRTIFFRNPPPAGAGSGARRLALAALFVAFAAFFLTVLARRTPAAAFFAWPTGVQPGWVAGGAAVAGLALWGARLAGRRWLAWVALAPWLLGALVGQGLEMRHEHRQAAALRQELAGVIARVEPLYVMPSELIPYVDRIFGGRPLLPLSALAALAADEHEPRLARLNTAWPLLDFERDTVAAALAGARKLSAKVGHRPIPSPLGMELITLQAPDRPALAALAARGFAPREAGSPPGTLMRVRPQDLHPGDGWGMLEAGPQGEVWRWSMTDGVKFRLPDPLPEGACTAVLKGMRLPFPPSAAAFSLRPAGGKAFDFAVPQNWFELRIPLAPGRGGSRNVLELTHPTFHQADFQPGATDSRRLGFLFLELRIEQP